MSRVSDLLRGSVVPGHLPQHSHHCHRLLITVHHGDDIWYDRALEQFEGDKMIKKDMTKV